MKKLFTLILLLVAALQLHAQKDSIFLNPSSSSFNIKITHTHESVPSIKKISSRQFGVLSIDSSKMDEIDLDQWKRGEFSKVNIADVQLNKSFSSKLVGNMLRAATTNDSDETLVDCVFLDSVRCAFVRRKKNYKGVFVPEWDYVYNIDIWKEFVVDSIHFVVIYDNSRHFENRAKHKEADSDDDEMQHPTIGEILLPLKNGQYTINESRFNLLPNNYPRSLFNTLSANYAADTVRVNGKYGYATLLGGSIIPAIYDSLKLGGHHIIAYKNRRIYMFDYDGKMVRSHLLAAHDFIDVYQVLDADHQMYYINQKNEVQRNYYRTFMGDDSFSCPTYWIIPPTEYDDEFQIMEAYPYRQQRSKPLLSDSTFMPYYKLYRIYMLDGFNPNYHQNDEFTFYSIPAKYKDPRFAMNGKQVFGADLHKTFSPFWVIASKHGKQGIIDVEVMDSVYTIVPFKYDSIRCVNQNYFLLKKKGLIGCYPAFPKLRYKKLDDFQNNFAHYQLPNGKSGWVDRTGKEYPDK